VPCLGILGEVLEKEGIDVIGPWEFLIKLRDISPFLALWIAAIVFAAVMLGRGGGRAERFLIAGASLKLIGNLISIPANFFIVGLLDRGYNIAEMSSIYSSVSLLINIVHMAGIICLIYAFWIRFKSRNAEGVEIREGA